MKVSKESLDTLMILLQHMQPTAITLLGAGKVKIRQSDENKSPRCIVYTGLIRWIR
ncbi:hypothetical protein X474_03360 [Dethiosulfatarculus sandiegensis]|uniref:Uncharacterized protein n=1 Tax=Dethiosulfatarculus sandiegensis TaxID=1429043 RepID=A0A0D2GKW9_9BACT|nr:hypothetical protein X474_03360 [Dethiosulfatarculus sandiegensis]